MELAQPNSLRLEHRQWQNRSVADGKQTFYRQATTPAMREKYALATDTMVGMFGSPPYQASMKEFLSRRKKPKPE